MKRVLKLLILFSFSYLTLFAQKRTENNDTTIYSVVDKFPVLIANGKYYELEKIREFIQANTFYPNNEADCQGSVIIAIIVEKDGTVKHKEFVRKLCPGYDENAMKVIDLMKKWKPGIRNGRKVRTKLNLKVIWRLE